MAINLPGAFGTGSGGASSDAGGGALTNFLQNSVITPAPTASTQASAGPLWLQDYLRATLGGAYNLAQQPYPQFPGPTVATPSDQTTQSWNMAGANVGNYQPDLTAATGVINDVNKPITSADVQTFLNPYQDYVTGQLNRNLTQNLLPQIQDKFVSAGQSRSPQEGEMTNRAVFDTQNAVGDAMAQAYQGALSSLMQERGQQLSGAGELGQLGALTSQLGQRDVGEIAAAGSAQDKIRQANLDAAQSQFQQQRDWPYQQIGFLSDVARGLPLSQAGSVTQQVGTTYPGAYAYGPSPLSILAGASGQNSALGPFKKGGHVRTHYGTGGISVSPDVHGVEGPAGWPGWTNLIPGVGAIQGGYDLATNPNPNYFHDLTSIGSLAPGPVGYGAGALSAIGPGGSLNQALFGTPIGLSNQQTVSSPYGNLNYGVPNIPSEGLFGTGGFDRAVGDVGSFFGDMGNNIGDAIGSATSGLGDFLSSAGSSIGDAFDSVGNWFDSLFSGGGGGGGTLAGEPDLIHHARGGHVGALTAMAGGGLRSEIRSHLPAWMLEPDDQGPRGANDALLWAPDKILHQKRARPDADSAGDALRRSEKDRPPKERGGMTDDDWNLATEDNAWHQDYHPPRLSSQGIKDYFDTGIRNERPSDEPVGNDPEDYADGGQVGDDQQSDQPELDSPTRRALEYYQQGQRTSQPRPQRPEDQSLAQEFLQWWHAQQRQQPPQQPSRGFADGGYASDVEDPVSDLPTSNIKALSGVLGAGLDDEQSANANAVMQQAYARMSPQGRVVRSTKTVVAPRPAGQRPPAGYARGGALCAMR